MAFACVISLKNTIERLLNSSHISLVPPSPKIIKPALEEVESLQEILERLDSSSKSNSRKRVNALDVQIREAVCKFEDVLESHVSYQIASQSESAGDEIHDHPLLFSIDLQDLKQDIHSFTNMVKKMEEEYDKELLNPLPEEDDEGAVPSRIDFGGKKSKMVGLSDTLSEIRDELQKFSVISLVGMAGTGKTAVAKEIFEDPLILSHFDCRAWVTVGRKCQVHEIARGILVQVDPKMDKKLNKGDEKIAEYLLKSLKRKRCLIVLDDVWDVAQVWYYFRSSLLENRKRQSRILLTTRLIEVASCPYQFQLSNLKIMRLLNQKESWDLLREKVFDEEFCPSQLEKAGKKIAENCDGLPLMIVTVADLLSKAEKTPEYWNKVADQKQNSVFMDAYDEISKVLFPSYEYLPQHLKPCFLYMGIFPQNNEIPRSKLMNMWIAEGLLDPDILKTLEVIAQECLEGLFYHSLVTICQTSTKFCYGYFADRTKTCRLHSSFWHLCNKEGEKSKFFHVLNSSAYGSEEGIKSQRRLCIHNSILFGINSMEVDSASTVRSLLCFGPYHQYPVPICLGLRLLRVLDALKIRFYEFPIEVLKLVQLRYLALTYNGKLPASISKLWNLQFLIIHRHMSIKSCGDPSYVPVEIWDMQELKHIQIMGSNLPNPNRDVSLENLLTLLNVSAHSCTKGVLKRISNLKRLGIQIELAPDDDSKVFSCLNHISHLDRLESFKCVVVNPKFGSEVVAPSAPLSMFPSSLKKLHLSGLGYPWEYMSIIGSMQHLQMLKLRCYAFRGPKWEIEKNSFLGLQFLVIEDTDLVQWKVGRGSFEHLNSLRIKHCYKLEELHWESDYGDLKKIEVVDCNPLAVTFVNQIKSRRGFTARDVFVHSSWDDGNLNSRLSNWSKGDRERDRYVLGFLAGQDSDILLERFAEGMFLDFHKQKYTCRMILVEQDSRNKLKLA